MNALLHYFNYNTVTSIVEILIIIVVTWLFYNRFIKGKNSAKFVRGIFVLVLLWFFSLVLIRFNFLILGTFVRYGVTFVLFGLVVIFQPELRKFLGMLGQAKFFYSWFLPKSKKGEDYLSHSCDEIIKAVEYMSSKQIGGLILFRSDMLGTIENPGVALNADISSELLLTIFHDKTPLHDGCVIISGNKILSAGAILPLTEKNKINWQYGTRHRAALGASEVLGVNVLVVSEETGCVSVASKGNFKKYDDFKKLKSSLRNILEKTV